MAQIVLNVAQIVAFVGQGVAAGMAKHVRMDLAQSGPLTSTPDKVVHALPRKLIAAFRDEQPG